MQTELIAIDALGDLRTLRNAIVHDRGVVTDRSYAKLKVLLNIASPGTKLAPSHDDMHLIFVSLKQAIGEMILHYTGHLPGAPKASEISGIAIQNAPKRPGRD